MPVISTFFGIVIRMFYQEHRPPHFHAEYGEYAAELSIGTMEVLRGNLPQRVLGLVLEWAAIHRDEWRTNWINARVKEPLNPIAPLE